MLYLIFTFGINKHSLDSRIQRIAVRIGGIEIIGFSFVNDTYIHGKFQSWTRVVVRPLEFPHCDFLKA